MELVALILLIVVGIGLVDRFARKSASGKNATGGNGGGAAGGGDGGCGGDGGGC
jgi:hypothetical protein